MNQNQLQSWLSSSQDPTKVSATVSGIILGASSFIVAIGMSVFHLQLTVSDVTSLATGLGMTAGAMVFVYGLIRKVVIKAGSVK